MPFIGNQPALSYTSFAKQDFSTSATTSYTLDHKVANENELALFINFVRQEAGTAYTASNNTLTLSSATSSSDDMYAIFLGKAIQTVNPPNASVGTSQLVDASITSGKLASGVLPTNTPAFFAYLNSNQAVSDNSRTKVQINTEEFDTDNAYDNTTNYRFTVPSGKAGKYLITSGLWITAGNIDRSEAYIYKNGSEEARSYFDLTTGALSTTMNMSLTLDLAVGDYIELYGLVDDLGGTNNFKGVNKSTYLGAFRIGD